MEDTKITTVCFICISILYFAQRCECKNAASQTTPFKFEDIAPENYDKLVPPLDNDLATVVKIRISVLNIQFVDEAKQVYGADIFFHQIWTDSRLHQPPDYNGQYMILDNQWRQRLWTPDTYFKNSLDGKVNDIIIPYSYLKIDAKSEVFFATRVSLKLNCEMNLASYPHDVQECEITVMSLQHTNDTVVLEWKDFEITKNILLAQYDVRGNKKSICTKTYSIGTFSCLRGKFQLARRLGYFIINKYIPCVLIVCMSFVTFWIPAEAYPARVTLAVTSLLTIVTQQYQSSMPSVSYIVALNIWMLSCIGFVFLTLLEYAVVIALMSKNGVSFCGFHCFKSLLSSKCEEHKVTGESSGMKHTTLDRISRIVFPLFFFLFCSSYWIVYSR